MSDHGVVSLTQARGMEIARKVRLTKTGAEFDESMTFEEYVKVGDDLMQIPESCPWWLGDYLNTGERNFGEKYSHVVSEKSAGTLMNMASVAGRFQISRRRENLSFSHHAVVAYLDPPIADALLDQAEQYGMSVTRLREAAKDYRRALKNPGAELSADKPEREVKMTGPAQKKPPKPEPVEEERHPIYGTAEENEPEIDPIEEWKRAEAELDQLTEELESLTTTDQAAEIRKLHKRIVGLEGRLRGEIGRANAAVEQVKYQNRVLRTVRDLLGVESNKEIQPRLLEFVQR